MHEVSENKASENDSIFVKPNDKTSVCVYVYVGLFMFTGKETDGSE